MGIRVLVLGLLLSMCGVSASVDASTAEPLAGDPPASDPCGDTEDAVSPGVFLAVDGFSSGSLDVEGWWEGRSRALGGAMERFEPFSIQTNEGEALRFEFPPHSDSSCTRNFGQPFDASAFEGVEMEIRADNSVSARVTIESFDSAVGGEYGAKNSTSECSTRISEAWSILRIPFESFALEPWILESHPGVAPEVNKSRIHEIHLRTDEEPDAIEIRRLGFYCCRYDSEQPYYSFHLGSYTPENELPIDGMSSGSASPRWWYSFDDVETGYRYHGFDPVQELGEEFIRYVHPDDGDAGIITCQMEGPLDVSDHSALVLVARADPEMDVEIGVTFFDLGLPPEEEDEPGGGSSGGFRSPISLSSESRVFVLPLENFSVSDWMLERFEGASTTIDFSQIFEVRISPRKEGTIEVLRVAFAKELPTPTPTHASTHGSIAWEMDLIRPGLTARGLKYDYEAYPEAVLGLRLDEGLDASAFNGVEIGMWAGKATTARVWVTTGDPLKEDGEALDSEMWAVSGEINIGSGQTLDYRIPFSEFHAFGGSAGESPSDGGIDLARLRGIYLEPLTEDATLEIIRLALFRDTPSGSTTHRHIDEHSLWSSERYGEWIAGLHGIDSRFWQPAEEALLTTTAWKTWGFNHQGGTLDVVDDPTGSGRGLVCRVTVPPRREGGLLLAESGPQIERWPGTLVSRVYGGVSFPHCEGPSVTSIDVFVDEELLRTAVSTTSGTVLLDIFDRCAKSEQLGCSESPHGDLVNSSLQAKLWTESRSSDGEVHLTLKYGGGAHSVADTAEGAPVFTANEWHTISIAIHESGIAELYQDGLLVARHEVSPTVSGGTMGGHPGLYIHDSADRGPYAVRGVFLFDNYRIRCGPDVNVQALVAEQMR